jgi:uncharacterized protein (TIGR02246 family)
VSLGCAPSVDLEAERAAVVEADRAWSQTAPDVEAFVAFYAPDGTLSPPDAPTLVGPQAIRAYLEPLLGAPELTLSWTTDKAEVAGAGDLAYTYGTYEMSFLDENGNKIEMSGKTQVIWKKQADGSWKVIADQFNIAPPEKTE